MSKKHRFLASAYKDGAVEFEAGQEYKPSERTAVYVATGVAVAVETGEPEVAAKPPRAPRGKKSKE